MSDTPETDALYRDDHKPNLLEHARRLERERDLYRNSYQAIKKAAEMYFLIEDISDESGYVCSDMPTLDEALDDLMNLVYPRTEPLHKADDSDWIEYIQGNPRPICYSALKLKNGEIKGANTALGLMAGIHSNYWDADDDSLQVVAWKQPVEFDLLSDEE